MKQLVIGVAAYLLLFSTSQAQVNSTWNGTSGNWSDFTRWSSNPLYPNNGNGGNDYNAFINGGAVNVDLPIAIQELVLGSGTIARANDLVVNADFTWNTFATVTGAGALQINGGGTLNTNALVYDGPIRFGDGVNASTIAHTNLGRLVLNNAAQASVRNGTTYEINVTGGGSNFGSGTSATPGAFTVEAGGILRKTGSATHQIANNVPLNNYGTIEVNEGELSPFGNTATWTNAGLISIAAGSIFQKTNGTMNLENGSEITGAGTFLQTNGALNAIADNSISRLQLQGGTFDRSASTTTTITDNFTWNFGSGSVTGAGALQIDGGGTLNANVLVYDGPIRFGDGVNASTIAHTNLGRLVLSNSAQASVRNGTTYEINVTGGGSNFGSGTSATPGAFTVEAGGILRKTGPATHLIANNVALNNYGTIEVNQGNLSFELGGVLNNHGTIEVNAGNLDSIFGGMFATNEGSITLAPGATVRGNVTNGSTGLLRGAGTVMGAVNLQTGGGIGAGISEAATTLTLTGGLTMADDSDYAVTLFGTGPSAISMLAVTGDADIATGANLRLDLSALSAVDVAALRTNIGEGNSRSYSVLTAMGTISGGGFDQTEFTIGDYGSFLASEWTFAAVTNANTVEITFTPVAGIPGDYNANGVVDAADYVVWRHNDGTANPLPNDPIGGTIGTAQYDQWQAHFGQTAGSGSSSPTQPPPSALETVVPEPRTATLCVACLAAGLALRRRLPQLPRINRTA